MRTAEFWAAAAIYDDGADALGPWSSETVAAVATAGGTPIRVAWRQFHYEQTLHKDACTYINNNNNNDDDNDDDDNNNNNNVAAAAAAQARHPLREF